MAPQTTKLLLEGLTQKGPQTDSEYVASLLSQVSLLTNPKPGMEQTTRKLSSQMAQSSKQVAPPGNV